MPRKMVMERRSSWAKGDLSNTLSEAFPETKTKFQCIYIYIYKLYLFASRINQPSSNFWTQSEHRYWGWSPNEASWATFPETKLASNHHWRKAAGGLWSWGHVSPWMFNPFGSIGSGDVNLWKKHHTEAGVEANIGKCKPVTGIRPQRGWW